jgi:hypothetical protein
MEEILAFVLGVSAVTFIWVIVVAFKTASRVKETEKTLEGIVHMLNRNDEMVNRRIDQEIDRIDDIHRECIRYTDSRVDKLEAKILSVDKDGCEPTKKILKG